MYTNIIMVYTYVTQCNFFLLTDAILKKKYII